MQIEQWYKQIPGQLLLETEHNNLSHLLKHLFGYHLLQIGGPDSNVLIAASPIVHKVRVSPASLTHYSNPQVQADPKALPFLPDSVDVIVMAHVIEYMKTPKQVLQQMYQVLIPEGHLIILGFNPYSSWGFMKRLPWCRGIPNQGRFISGYRVRRWLTHQGFSIVHYRSVFHRPPLTNSRLLNKLLFLEAVGQLCWPYLGGTYLIVAKKQISALTFVGPMQPLKSVPASSYLEPSAQLSQGEKP